MKKVLFLGLVFGAVAFTSCSKTYTCDFGSGISVDYDSKDFTQSQLDLAESACKTGNGTWTSK